MEEDEHQECVLEQRHATQEPRLAQDECENAVVHGISGKAIETRYDEHSRRVDGCESALALGEEVPDAAEQGPTVPAMARMLAPTEERLSWRAHSRPAVLSIPKGM